MQSNNAILELRLLQYDGLGMIGRRYHGVMRECRALTKDELARAEQLLRNPRPGSRIEAAQRHGVDLTLLIEQLRLTPAERVLKAQAASTFAEELRGAARRTRK
ncbi:MAG TPA: hypothetical protein VGR73_11535 [Bryobacteraceae bacterium]|nr:hypothetical protein [Bryobacteraceae bacterium]